MSVNGHRSISIEFAPPVGRPDEQVFGEVRDLGDEFSRLGETLRQRAREVAALVERANVAEEGRAALLQRQEEQDRVIDELRDQLDLVNARVAEFQEAGARHLAESRALVEDYARRVAVSEEASETLRARVTELIDLVAQRDDTIAALQSLFTAQDERVAQLRRRAESAAAIEALMAESLQAASQYLNDLMALNDENGRPPEHHPAPEHHPVPEHHPAPARATWAAAAHETPIAAHEATPAVSETPGAPDDATKESGQARGWYRRMRPPAD